MKKTTVNITFETDQPLQVDRVIFESLQRAVRGRALDHDLEFLSQMLVAAMKDQEERWEEERRKDRDNHETTTIHYAVKAGVEGDLSDEEIIAIGRI